MSDLAYSVCLGMRRGNQNVEATAMNDLRRAGCGKTACPVWWGARLGSKI